VRLLILAVLANVVDAAGASDLVGVVSGFWSVLASLCIASLSLLWIFTVTAVLRKATRRAKWMQFLWIFFVSSGHLHDRFSLGFGVGVHAMVPLTAAERRRAEARSGLLPTGDRVALDATRNRRKRLFLQFQTWLWKEKGVSLLFLLRQKPAEPEVIASWLVAYGQELYRTGKAYGIYAETVNSVASARPQIRKQLTLAWDYAYSWISDEPFGHHPALPASVLLALVSIAILWGWATEAAVFGLAWSGILRIGEVLQATRADLILPRDAVPGTIYVLLKIKEPKTRGKHARHQLHVLILATLCSCWTLLLQSVARMRSYGPFHLQHLDEGLEI
jgi:hypothetical protein